MNQWFMNFVRCTPEIWVSITEKQTTAMLVGIEGCSGDFFLYMLLEIAYKENHEYNIIYRKCASVSVYLYL